MAVRSGYKQTEAGLIPKDWSIRPMLSVVHIANGQVDPRTEPYRHMTLVAPDHIERGTGQLLRKEYAADQNAISGKYLFSSGDIVYSKIRPYLRKAILADKVAQPVGQCAGGDHRVQRDGARAFCGGRLLCEERCKRR